MGPLDSTGFAHGYVVLSDHAECYFKLTSHRILEYERCIAWNDKDLNIQWPLSREPLLSQKDRLGNSLKDATVFP